MGRFPKCTASPRSLVCLRTTTSQTEPKLLRTPIEFLQRLSHISNLLGFFVASSSIASSNVAPFLTSWLCPYRPYDLCLAGSVRFRSRWKLECDSRISAGRFGVVHAGTVSERFIPALGDASRLVTRRKAVVVKEVAVSHHLRDEESQVACRYGPPSRSLSLSLAESKATDVSPMLVPPDWRPRQ